MDEATRLQDRIIDQTVNSLNHNRDAFINAPTGAGKSRKFSRIAEQRARHSKVLVLTNRKKLINQGIANMDRWSDHPVPTSIGMDGVIDQSGDVVYATVQTAKIHANELVGYGTLIIDEAHHASKVNTEFNHVISSMEKNNPNMLMVGVSATPPEGYEGMHPRLAAADKHVMTFEEAIAARLVELPETILPKMRYKGHEAIQDIVSKHLRTLTGAKLESGISTALKKMQPDDWFEQTADQYERHLAGGRTLAFFDSIADAQKFTDVVRERGYKVELVHSRRSKADNDQAFETYDQGKLAILASVDMISEGIDLDADGILLDKRTTSSTEYRQIIGREARGHGVGKETKAKLIDTGASTVMHGDIGSQAAMQTIRGGMERSTISNEEMLPDSKTTMFRPWIEMKSDNKTVYATSIDGAVVYAVPTQTGYAAFSSIVDKKGTRLEGIAIDGERKGQPSRKGFGDWVGDAIRRNERSLARLLSPNLKHNLAGIVEADWKRNAASVARNISIMSMTHERPVQRGYAMAGIGR